jgi:hypothetical protein
MVRLEALDPGVPIFQQIGADVSPVVLVNVFHVAEDEIPALLAAWEADASPHLFTRLTVPNLCVGP